MKKLIVNADDFGMSEGINQGIIAAHRDGILTSASLMVLREGTTDAVQRMRINPRLEVGLHAELPDKIFQSWLDGGIIDFEEAKNVIAEQVHRFLQLTERMPSNINFHKIFIVPTYVHPSRFNPALNRALAYFQETLGIPYRGMTGVYFTDAFHGNIYDEHYHAVGLNPHAVSPSALMNLLRHLPEGVSEIMCHPALWTDGIDSSYVRGREIEFDTLTSSLIRDAVKSLDISLVTYSHLNPRAKEDGTR